MPGKIVVVLGKSTIHKIELEPLRKIGQAIAIRDHILRTTRTPGACRAVVEGYESQGKEATYVDGDPEANAAGVIVFTDTKYQAKLTERLPDWRDRDWLVFHNRKATQEAASMITQILSDLGTPLPDGGE